MSGTVHSSSHAAERRVRIEAVLASYPHIAEEDLADLLHWFRKEASPLEVGLIAGAPELAQPYQRLKAEHLDRLRGADLMRAAIVTMVAIAGLVTLALWRIT